MPPLPVAVLLGVYLGILTGIIPGLVAWGLGFVFKYFTGVTIPGFGVVVLALAIAGVNGGFLALNDPSIRQRTGGATIVTAILVVLMISLYAHSKGDAMGATFPRRVSLRGIRQRTLSRDVVELVGGHSRVRITVGGEVLDMEGYPALPDEIRRAIREGEWTFPADLPIHELETRFAERLRTEFDLADVSVRLDETARATVVAAPPLSGLSRRVPAGARGVSVDALVPSGVARGDEVDLVTAVGTFHGTVLSARSGDATLAPPAAGSRSPASTPTPTGGPAGGGSTGGGGWATGGGGGATGGGGGATAADSPVGGESEAAPAASRARAAPTTTGGEGRVTVAVSRGDAEALLRVTRAKVVVTSRGHRREYELLSVLRRAGKRFRKLSVVEGGDLDGRTVGEAALRGDQAVAILAVRQDEGWVMVPGGTTELRAGDELFVVGSKEALSSFGEGWG